MLNELWYDRCAATGRLDSAVPKEHTSMAGPQPTSITVTPPQRAVLEQLIRQHRAPQALVRRAHIILAAADGARNTQIARTLGCAYNTVRTWRLRWAHAPALDVGT